MKLEEVIPRFRDRLLRDPKFLLTTHRTPDPDGIGAELAIDYVLRHHGKDVIILNQDPVPPKYRFLDLERRIGNYATIGNGGHSARGRTVVMLDNSDVDRTGEISRFVEEDRSNLVIFDHHDAGNPDFENTFQVAEAGSTSEMAYELLILEGLPIPGWLATAIYAGIVFDTGFFRYSKTKPRTLRIGAELMEKGVRPSEIAEALYSSHPVERLYLKKELYAHMKLTPDQRVAYFQIRKSDVEKMNLTLDDLDGIINELIEPDPVQIGILFTEREPGMTRVSLRSRGSVNLIPAVQQYGGGGHKNACGATIRLDLEEAVREFIPLASSCIK